MRAGFVLVMLGVVACGPPPIEMCNIGGTGGFTGTGGAGGGFVPIGATGQPFTVTLSQPRVFFCGKRNVADEVVTQVLDPLNRGLAHTHSAPVSNDLFSTQVTFTPPGPGTYHLSARFEPSIGTTQQDVQVAVGRAGPSRRVDTGVWCDAFEELPSGTVLCLNSERQLRVIRDGGVLQTLPADDFAVVGSTVWTTNGRDVQRRVEVAGTLPLILTHTLDSSTNDGDGTLFATDRGAVLISSYESVKLDLDGGDPMHAAGKSNRSVVIATPGLDALLFINAGPSGSFSSTQLCSLRFEPVMTPRCRTLGPFEGLGADSTGLWSRDDFSLRHDAFSADGGIETATMALPGVLVPPLSRHFQSAPVFESNGRAIVPRFGPEGITLDSYDLIAGFTFMPSSASTVRAQDAAGHQQLFTR